MRASTVLLFAIISVGNTVHGQRLTVEVKANYGFYNLKDMKDLQTINTFYLTSYASQPKIVERFPSRIGPELNVTYSFGRYSLGMYGSFISTGGRISDADYSGELKSDQIVSANQIGIYQIVDFIRRDRWRIFADLRSGISFSTVKFRTSVVVDGFSLLNDSETYKAKQIILFPGIGAAFLIKNELFVRAEVQFLSLPYSENINNYYPYQSTRVGWDGLQVSLGIGYTFKETAE